MLSELIMTVGLKDENLQAANEAFSILYSRHKEKVMADCADVAKGFEKKIPDYKNFGRNLFQDSMAIFYEKASNFDVSIYPSETQLKGGFFGYLRKIALRLALAHLQKYGSEEAIATIMETLPGLGINRDGEEEMTSDDLLDAKLVKGLSSKEKWKLIRDPFNFDAEDIFPKDILRRAVIKKKMMVIDQELNKFSQLDQEILLFRIKYGNHPPAEERDRIIAEYGISEENLRTKKSRLLPRLKKIVLDRYKKL